MLASSLADLMPHDTLVTLRDAGTAGEQPATLPFLPCLDGLYEVRDGVGGDGVATSLAALQDQYLLRLDANKQRRASKFREIGLEYEFGAPAAPAPIPEQKATRRSVVRFDKKPETCAPSQQTSAASAHPTQVKTSLFSRGTPLMFRLGTVALVLALLFPFLRGTPLGLNVDTPIPGVEAGPIPRDVRSDEGIILARQDDSPTDVCFRWAQQSAMVNGTLYLYGGQASTRQGQDQDTWNNNFLTLDLTKTWNIASPSLTGLPQPSSSGPPAVALGYLWSSHESLFLYGGQFSWKPAESPTAFSTWEYSMLSEEWIEHSNPQTSSGESAPSNSNDVQRAAEGAGVNVPTLGRGFYFGGHLDGYTTQGWSQSVPRVYLQSLLEFTFPGAENDQIESLGDGKTAGEDGVYRNITQGGLQDSAGFTERADGLLIYIPGFGDEGILLALAGGSNETFTQMNNIDVYDIATSEWYKQSTSGPTPEIRVNPCAVTAAAADGSSYNIYMFGGQNLIPYGNQTQYDDMWILSVPSFTWIEVDTKDQSTPYGRSGHTCDIWNGQMIVVGGYVGDELSCESPGIYVFDLSSLEWVQQYTALSAGPSDGDSDADSNATDDPSDDKFNSTGSNNPFNQQQAQLFEGSDFGGLEGSYGYQVPEVVIKAIGGDGNGGATVTTPVATATGGPLATGKPVTYTVTSGGATATETSGSEGGGSGGGSNSGSGSSGDSGPNIAAIVAGVIAGILFLLVCYLLFCTYIYRKQLGLYKHHVEMAQAQARGEKVPAIPGLLATNESGKTSSERKSNGSPHYSGSGEGSSRGRRYEESAQESGSGSAYPSDRRGSSTEDLLAGREPTFVGVLLNPRRSLRVVNKD
ncbi:hypothetical protein Q7P37_006153 [Cladosporium fusiforme]